MRLVRLEGIDEPYRERLGHASGDLSTVQPGYFGRLCGRLRGTRHGAAAEDQGHNTKAHVLVNACQLTRLDDDAGLLENFPPYRVARVLVQLDDPAGHTPGHLLLRTRNGVHRRGVARSRGQDPRIHHRDPDQSRPCRRAGPRRRSRPGRPQASLEKEAQPGPARGRVRRGRGESHRVDTQGLAPGERARRPLGRRRHPRRPGRQPQRQARRPGVLLPAPTPAAPRPRVRGTQEETQQEPAEQKQSARRLDPSGGPGRHRGPARRGKPGAGRVDARGLRHDREAAGPALPRLLRLHVLRADAPVRGRRAHQGGLPPARDRLGSPDLRGLQPRSREGLHRRRPGPRAPRPQRPDQGQAHREGPQARAEGPDPARARRALAHAHRPVRRGPGRAAVPLREREPAPAVHLVAGLAEGPGRVAHPPAAGLAADEAPL